MDAWDRWSQTWEPGQVNMAGRRMDDAKVNNWCTWFAERDRSSACTVRGRLTELDFSNNFLTDTGVKVLLEFLKQHEIQVQSLKLFGNKINSHEDIIRFMDWSRGALKELHLSNNKFDADAVCEIIVSAVSLRVYPLGRRPLWLRIGGGKNPSYNGWDLERALRSRIDLEKHVHIYNPDANEDGCSNKICCRASPTPAVHAPYLFPHWTQQKPSLLHVVNNGGSINYPRIIENGTGKSLDMSGQGLCDADLTRIFQWIEREFVGTKQNGCTVVLKEVNVANNHLTTSGLTRLVRFLKRARILLSVLRMNGNDSEHGDNVDFTVLMNQGGLKESKICPVHTSGCICGRKCESIVAPEVLYAQWEQFIDTNKLEVNMENKGIDDVAMHDWCIWFQSNATAAKLHGSLLSKLNFSINHLTCRGVAELLNTMMSVQTEVKSLMLHANQICLAYGSDIERFVQWNRGSLKELHISKNRLDANAITDILVQVLSLADEFGTPCYPAYGKSPFWFRAEHNNYESSELEGQLRSAFHAVNRSLDKEICNTTDADNCNPRECGNDCMEATPAIHAKYLFRHWERYTSEHKEAAPRARTITIKAAQQALQNALHGHAVQQEELRVLQPYAKPVDRRPQRSTSIPASAEQSCPGFLRPSSTPIFSLALAPIYGRTHCFLSQTLFRKANVHQIEELRVANNGRPYPEHGYKDYYGEHWQQYWDVAAPYDASVQDSFVSAAELRHGDLLIGSRAEGVRVINKFTHAKASRNIVRIRAENSDSAFVVTSDHRIQVSSDGSCLAAGRISRDFQEYQQRRQPIQTDPPMIYDGSSLHAVNEASYKKEKVAVIEVHFEGDAVAYVWLRPRRWRNRAEDCPTIAVRGEHPYVTAPGLPGPMGPEEQLERYGLALHGPFIEDVANSNFVSAQSSARSL